MKQTSPLPRTSPGIRLVLGVGSALALLLCNLSNDARAQMPNQPFINPQMAQQQQPYRGMGFPAPNAIPQANQNFNIWKAFLPRHIPIGTVLSGNIDKTLSSVKSKPGDLFAINLSEPLMVEGLEMVPPGSRILGSILHVSPAKFQKHGTPGQIDVALQTLIFPDGSHTPFFGFIDYNPSYGNGFDSVSPAKVRHSGTSWSDYGNQVKGMVGSFGQGVAWVHNNRMLGKEFTMAEGQLLSIKTNRMIDLSKMERPPASLQANQQNMAPRTPGLAGHDPDFHYYAGPNQNPNAMNGPAPVPAPPPDNSIFDAPIDGGTRTPGVIPGFNQVPGPGPQAGDPF
ncbi:hypothetical protein KA183_01410 [bacterium]|nr:hypothetical protein [bacterium]QQR59055.1 MAG: hypothetical protein IPG59_06075 [Candidatus Melainabacteria bacterium]